MAKRTEAAPTLTGAVLIPAGPFLFGEEQELKYLEPYEIDVYPVTVELYARFVEVTGHPAPDAWPDERGLPGRATHPVTGVSFYDALAYARWLGRELPTEEQWEKAARGTDGRTYPWGNRFNVRNLNSRGAKKRATTPVDLYEAARSPFDVVDMSGNAWEWTDSWYDADADLKVLKGGCHTLTKEYAAASYRHYNDPDFGNNLTGFRTVRSL